MDYRIFHVRTDVDACDCTRECTDTARQSALKVDSGRKTSCRTGESNLCQRRISPSIVSFTGVDSNELNTPQSRLIAKAKLSPPLGLFNPRCWLEKSHTKRDYSRISSKTRKHPVLHPDPFVPAGSASRGGDDTVYV